MRKQKHQMFTWLGKRSDGQRKARELYGAVVAQARAPVFYSRLGVADTMEGRYELVALHLILALERLGQPDVASEELRRETLETFVTDMDDCLREIGAGDASVPKRVKRAAGGVYARSNDYGAALGQDDDSALIKALTQHVYQGDGGASVAALAHYVRQARSDLAGQTRDALRAGVIRFPQPEAP